MPKDENDFFKAISSNGSYRCQSDVGTSKILCHGSLLSDDLWHPFSDQGSLLQITGEKQMHQSKMILGSVPTFRKECKSHR